MEIEDRLKKAKYINLEAPDTKTIASLCLYADDIDINAITTALGCEPTEAHCRGDIVKKRSPAKIGLWHLNAPEDLSFTDQLKYLVDKTNSSQATWDKLASNHEIMIRCAVFLHSWTDGFDLPAVLLEEIGKRHWEFGLSVYSAEGNEIVDAFLKPKEGDSNNKE